MSPSEADLRAALRAGESDGDLDVDVIVWRGRNRRSQRRARILSAAAVVAFVGAAATGGTLLLNSGGSSNSSASKTAGGAGNGYSAPAAGAASRAGGASGGLIPHSLVEPTGAACPRSWPGTSAPDGDTTARLDPTAALFAKPVASLVVCSYGSPQATTSSPAPTFSVLVAGDAQALVTSLESAAHVQRRVPCPMIRTSAQLQLAFIGLTASGDTMPAVVTTLALPVCNTVVTNGTAVRYDWTPTPAIRAQLVERTSAGTQSLPASAQPSGKNVGSPVH